jgi:capsule polysaccharide export protein KpsE/RkpR
MMSLYKTSKKVRYTISIIYIIFMGFILAGTYWSQQKTEMRENTTATSSSTIGSSIPEP